MKSDKSHRVMETTFYYIRHVDFRRYYCGFSNYLNVEKSLWTYFKTFIHSKLSENKHSIIYR